MLQSSRQQPELSMSDDDWKYSEPYLRNRGEAAEQIRAATITALGRAHDRRDLADLAVMRGVPLSHFERHLLEEIAEPQRPMGAIGMSRSEVSQWSLFRWLQNPEPKTSLELECSRAAAKAAGLDDPIPGQLLVPLEVIQRDLNTSQGSAGGYLVSTKVQSFIGALYARSVPTRLGATRISGLIGDTTVPRVSQSATAYWLSDDTSAPTETQATLNELAMSPKTVGALCELSRRIVMQTSPAVESLAMADLGGVLAQAVDAAAINGSGTLGEPLGILNTPEVGAFTGGSLDSAALVNAQVDVATGNAIVNDEALGYATTPAVAALLKARHRVADTNSPLWEGAVHSGMVEGVRAMSSTTIPTATMVYGDWSQLAVGEWGVLDLRTNPYANFKAGIVSIRAFWTIDIAVRHAAVFSIAGSIT
jgi:HK97 family phage major capsid protein